jgi:archaellum component FlaC
MLSLTAYKAAVLVLLITIPSSTVATVYYYQQQANSLNNQLSNLKGGVGSVNSTFTGQIATLNSEVAGINNQISSLNTLVGTVNSTLKAQISSLQTQVNTLNSQVGTLNSQVSTLESNVSLLQSEVSTLMADAASLQSQVNQILSQLAVLAGNRFQATAGPVTIFLDYKSFNFTQGAQTVSQPAFVVPTGTNMVFWLRMANAATDSSVTIQFFTALVFTPYSSAGLGTTVPFYVVDSATVNPTNVVAYNNSTNPYVLPAAPSTGPASSVIVKFASTTQGGATPRGFSSAPQTFLVMIAFYYVYRGQA